MKTFVDWVLAHRLRPIIVAAVAAPLLQVVSVAMIALETVRRGVTGGAICGVGMVVGLSLLAMLSGADTSLFATIGVICAVSGVGIGVLIRRTGNLVLAFQAAMLIGLLAVAAIYVLGIDVRGFFKPAIDDFVALLQTNEIPPEEVAFIEERGAAIVLGMVFSLLIGALLLSYWWSLLAARQRSFGQEFRSLALGRVLGSIATLLVVLGLVFDTELVQNLTPLAVLGFLLQGVAVVHSWAHAKRWHPALIAPLYVLMLMPVLNVFVVVPLGVVGVVDNWFDLRALIRPQTLK